MKKLLKGIAEFRRRRPPFYVEEFSKLALDQTPDALLVCCSDSRVAPNVFASVEPGDLVVVRNVGNLVPLFEEAPARRGGASVPAAIELALQGLHVGDIIVCGHSECAAMRSIASGRPPADAPHLAAWLRHGEPALTGLGSPPAGMPLHDHLSQRSTLLQLENLRSYPIVRDAETAGRLRLHAWWFDIRKAEVLDFDKAVNRFVLLDEQRVARLLAK